LKVENIIGMPIVSIYDGSQLGIVTSIIMDQTLKNLKRIQLNQERFIILDDIVQFGKSAILVKNSKAVQKFPVPNHLNAFQDRLNENVEAVSVESTSANWWVNIKNWK